MTNFRIEAGVRGIIFISAILMLSSRASSSEGFPLEVNGAVIQVLPDKRYDEVRKELRQAIKSSPSVINRERIQYDIITDPSEASMTLLFDFDAQGSITQILIDAYSEAQNPTARRLRKWLLENSGQPDRTKEGSPYWVHGGWRFDFCEGGEGEDSCWGFTVIPLATPASSGPSVEEIKLLLHDWARAWENNVNSVDQYMTFYDLDFRSNYKSGSGMDYRQWKADKSAKGGKAGCIRIEISAINVDVRGDRATARFMQRYVSDSYCDQGYKELALVKREGKWRIIGEDQPDYKKCNERCRGLDRKTSPGAPIKRIYTLAKDSLGGISPGDDVSKVLKKYGPAEAKEDNSMENVRSFCFFGYPSRGLSFQIVTYTSCDDGSVMEIQASGNSSAVTGGGIRIGSTRSEFEQAYGKGQSQDGFLRVEDHNADLYVEAEMLDNKVKALWLGFIKM